MLSLCYVMSVSNHGGCLMADITNEANEAPPIAMV